MKYLIVDREAGYLIDEFNDKESAEKALAEYEEQDKRDDIYVPDFYEIIEKGLWYAVLEDVEDNDWSDGSYNLSEAINMAKRLKEEGFPNASIAVIDEGSDPICVDIIDVE